jgi:phosphohistidine phosphatase SixA
MKFYIMRHAHAEEGDRMDPHRAITKYGKWQSKVMQKFVKQVGCKMDLVLTSDFARGVETGDYFRPKKARHIQLRALRPCPFGYQAEESASEAWAAILKVLKPEYEHVLIIGHGPTIHEMVRACCFTFEPEEKILAHGNMVKVQTQEEHQFHWLMTPALAAHVLGIEDETDSEDGRADEMAEQGKDPESLAIDEAALELAAAMGISLKEALDHPDKRAVIDPLVAKVQKGLRIRWASQLKHLETYGLPMVQESLLHVSTLRPNGMPAPDHDKRQVLAALPLHSQPFAVKFRKATSAAYTAGADRAAAQLPSTVTEATPVKKHPPLPGPSREPEDVEDSLDDTTTERVGSIIDKAFLTPLTYAAMVGLVREEFQSWMNAKEGETSRAETVALQEVSTAYHDGGSDFVDNWRGGNGPVEKRWNAEDDACEECLANEAEGFIDSEAPHSSGDDEPPAHPNCRCEEEYQAVSVEESLR